MENGKIRKNLGEVAAYSFHCAPHSRKRNLRAGIHFPDAFVFDPIVTAQAVGRAERFVTLAARVFLHLLYEEKRKTVT